jgi:hypothetical protein
MGTARSPERQRFLCDVAITAAEGGYSWFQYRGYRWFDPELTGGRAEPGPDGGPNVTGEIREYWEGGDEDDHGPWTEFGPDLIAKGLRKIQTDETIDLNKGSLGTILVANRKNDGGDIDADLADVVLQVALLGEVRYG